MEKAAGEVLNINNEYQTYQEYKAAVDSELQKSAESFVRIGYLLKVARDTDILKDSGYNSVNEFAYGEYGLDKSQVSRFININDEFSENGYSDRLQEKYRNFGYAKLALMLLLPDAVRKELSADYSKAEIQEIKEEIDAEKKITDLEVMMEGQDRQQALMKSNLCKVMHQIGHDQPELYIQLHECGKKADGRQARLKEILAPSGENMYSVRIQGTGRLMIFFWETGEEIPVTNIRNGEKEIYTWQQVQEALGAIVKPGLEAEASWQEVYGEPFPVKAPEKAENTKVAPVQPKDRQRKQSRVIKAGSPDKGKLEEKQEEEKKPEKEEPAAALPEAPAMPEGSSTEKEPEEETGQEPKQMELKEYTGIMPEDAGEGEDGPVQPSMPYLEKEKRREYLLEALKKNTELIYYSALRNDYKEAEEYIAVVKEGLKELKNMRMHSTDKKEGGAG